MHFHAWKSGMYYLRSKEHQRLQHGNEQEGAVAKTTTAQAAAAIPTTEVAEKSATLAPTGKPRNTFEKKRNTIGKKPVEATAAEASAFTIISADQLDGACWLDDPDSPSCGA